MKYSKGILTKFLHYEHSVSIARDTHQPEWIHSADSWTIQYRSVRIRKINVECWVRCPNDESHVCIWLHGEAIISRAIGIDDGALAMVRAVAGGIEDTAGKMGTTAGYNNVVIDFDRDHAPIFDENEVVALNVYTEARTKDYESNYAVQGSALIYYELV